jgi:hypothetical protein
MAIQTHKRPDLREPIANLCKQLVPAVTSGGQVPLTALVEAVAGDRLDADVRRKLDSRKAAVFELDGQHTAFFNEGPEVKIELKKFNIKIPKRLAGHARLVDDGAILRFSGDSTLHATKFFFSVRLETIELTTQRVFIDMEGDSFDQCFDLT